MLALVAGMCLGASSAVAQDSTSNAAGTAGDAVNAYTIGATSEQINNYTVRLSPLATSWGGGRVFGFAPLAKASRATTFSAFNHVLLAQTASPDLVAAPLLRASYAEWAGPGIGVGAVGNVAPGAVSTAGLTGYQFATAFSELGIGGDLAFSTNDDDEHLVAQFVGLTLADPSRLYVSRVNTLSNKPTTGQNAACSLGLGAIDAAGHLHAYADGYGVTTANRLTDREYVRVNAAARSSAVVNNLQSSGFTDAAASLRVAQTTLDAFSVPSIIPTSIPGGAGRPVLLGTDLSSNLRYESVAGTTSLTRVHLPNASTPNDGLRGSMTFVPRTFSILSPPGGVGYCAALARTDTNTTTRGIQLWGVSATGSPLGEVFLQLPTVAANLMDPLDNFSPGVTFPPLSGHEFTNYASQLPFRGGSSPVASIVLPSGELLAAALISPGAAGGGGGGRTPQSLDNAIAVAKVTPGLTVSWTIAAHSGTAAGFSGGLSKAILGDAGADGIPGTGDSGEGDGVLDATPIGRIAKANEGFALAATGPSISSPAFDAAGNLYFVASVALNTTTGTQYSTALIRGNRDSVTGGYRLELLLKAGDVIAGQNSLRNYQIQSLALADADSGETGSMFSSATVKSPLPGVVLAGPGAIPLDAPTALTALVFRARIVYDVNQDSQFVDPSLVPGSTSSDQGYNVAMIMMPLLKISDYDRDGVVSVVDLFGFLDAWFAQNGLTGLGILTDLSGDAAVDVVDLFQFLDAWFAGL